ncbi:hypothetical protein BVI2075_230018 [Burkholderia vietnamiensis]|nr:hypothetical protein BVI2075_230018 [Burkholderia vietnamiensis]
MWDHRGNVYELAYELRSESINNRNFDAVTVVHRFDDLEHHSFLDPCISCHQMLPYSSTITMPAPPGPPASAAPF